MIRQRGVQSLSLVVRVNLSKEFAASIGSEVSSEWHDFQSAFQDTFVTIVFRPILGHATTHLNANYWQPCILMSEEFPPSPGPATQVLLEDDIARLAYRYYQEEGCPQGCAEEHWLPVPNKTSAASRLGPLKTAQAMAEGVGTIAPQY